MSYSCFISFKQISADKVADFLREFKQCVTSHLQDIAQENYNYVPYIRKADLNDVSKSMTREEWQKLPPEQQKELFPRDFRNVDAMDIDMARYWARSSVFQYRYGYDTEHQLLCMFGVPNAAQALFDGTVYFQNSCDQNYEESEWAGVKSFEQIYNKWMQMSDADVLKWYHDKYGETLYDACDVRGQITEDAAKRFAAQMDYTRKSAAYNEIWSNYEDMLYNDEQCVYISLYGPYEILPMNIFLKACHDAHVNWRDEGDKEYFEMLCGKRPNMQRAVERMMGHAIDAKNEMAIFLAKHTGYLEKFPDLQEMYDELMGQDPLDEPEESK